MLRNVELDLAGLLESAELGLSTTTNPPTLYVGPTPSGAPDACVRLLQAGGDSEEYVGAGEYLFVPEVQVLVRGARNSYQATLEQARLLFTALHFAQLADYVSIRCEGAGPDYLGPDENGRPRFVFTVACMYAASRIDVP